LLLVNPISLLGARSGLQVGEHDPVLLVHDLSFGLQEPRLGTDTDEPSLGFGLEETMMFS
jgi:hypothetical protein